MPESPLVDSHCHLHFSAFDHDRDQVLANFSAIGGRWLLAVAVAVEDFPRLRLLAEAHAQVFFSVGVHPNETGENPSLASLCEAAAHPKCVAIGETGLDFYRHQVSPEVQSERFRLHIRAAKELGKPLIVHMRESDAATLKIMEEEGVAACGGVMHCFSSNGETAREALALGMHISFAGNVTFRRNAELRRVAARIPTDRLLIETDAPYLTPEPKRGRRNEPAMVAHVAACVAAEMGIPVHRLAHITTNNSCRLFGVGMDKG